MGSSSFRLDLPNGWTFSVSDEMRPFVCNVAAWPTEDDATCAADHQWFEWADGRTDVRCVSMGEVSELLKEVLASGRPTICLNSARRNAMIELGSKARDRITGFVGIITGRASYLTGCDQYLINPPSRDGALVDSQWFDEQRLEVDTGADVIRLDNSAGNGADRAAPKR